MYWPSRLVKSINTDNAHKFCPVTSLQGAKPPPLQVISRASITPNRGERDIC